MFLKKANKYRNKKIVIDGIRFDSIAEGERYLELKLLEQSGSIVKFEIKPVYQLYSSNGIKIAKYIPDFRYRYTNSDIPIVEDVKGKKTPVYQIKKKWLVADYPDLEFREVYANKRR